MKVTCRKRQANNMHIVKTEKELVNYRNRLGYTFTLDDFILEYRIGKTNAKKYLNEVNSIKLTQSLFLKMKKQYPNTIQHVKYYNENEVFLTLLDKGIIKFQYKKLIRKYGDIERLLNNDWYEKEMKIYDIPNKFIKEHLLFFKEYCLKISPTASETSKNFDNKPKQYERALNNELTSIVSTIGGVSRYHVLLDKHNELDFIISFLIFYALEEDK